MGSYVLGFAATYLLFAIGFGTTHLFDTGSPYVFHITQFFYSISTATAIWALTKRAGQPPYLGVLLVIYALSAVTLGVAVVTTPEISSRLIIVNVGYGAMYLVCLMSLLGGQRREAIDKLIIVAHSILAAQFMIRPVLTLLVEQGIAAEGYRQSVYYSVLNLSLALISLMSAMVLVGACVYDQIKAVREQAELDGAGLTLQLLDDQVVFGPCEGDAVQLLLGCGHYAVTPMMPTPPTTRAAPAWWTWATRRSPGGRLWPRDSSPWRRIPCG